MSWKGLIASKGFDFAILQQVLTETSDLGETLREWGSLILETVSSHQTCFFILYLLPGWTAWSIKSLQHQLMGWELSAPQRLTHISCGQHSRAVAPPETCWVPWGGARLHLGSLKNIQQGNNRKTTCQHWSPTAFRQGEKQQKRP